MSIDGGNICGLDCKARPETTQARVRVRTRLSSCPSKVSVLKCPAIPVGVISASQVSVLKCSAIPVGVISASQVSVLKCSAIQVGVISGTQVNFRWSPTCQHISSSCREYGT